MIDGSKASRIPVLTDFGFAALNFSARAQEAKSSDPFGPKGRISSAAETKPLFEKGNL
jgi:hypothetical protein